jgi:hypothetical protein
MKGVTRFRYRARGRDPAARGLKTNCGPTLPTSGRGQASTDRTVIGIGAKHRSQPYSYPFDVSRRDLSTEGFQSAVSTRRLSDLASRARPLARGSYRSQQIEPYLRDYNLVA